MRKREGKCVEKKKFVQRENAAHTRYGNGRRANRRHTTALPFYKTLVFLFYFVIKIAKNILNQF